MHLFSRRTSLRAHQTGHVSDARFNFTSASGASQTSAETETHTKVPARIACIISYQIAKETKSMQCRDQLSHEVIKKAIKAAIKLCVHVICYILEHVLMSYIKNMSLKWFSKLSWSILALSPSSNTLDSTRQLIRRDWNGSEKVDLRENTMLRSRHVQQQQVLKEIAAKTT